MTHSVRGSQDAPPLVVLYPDDADPVTWGNQAGLLAATFRVHLLPTPPGGRRADWPGPVMREIGKPAAVVGYGSAAPAAYGAWRDGADITALILVEATLDEAGLVPTVPTLVLRGRQSEVLGHEEAVRLFQRLPHGRLFELESCGSDPAAHAPEAFEASIRWFLANLPGQGVHEYSSGQSGEEPVDPGSLPGTSAPSKGRQ